MTDQLHYLLVTSDPVISDSTQSDISMSRRQLQPRGAAGEHVDISQLLKSPDAEAGQQEP